MRIAAAQLNQIVGDFDGNARRILEAARAAVSQSVSVLVTPELSLSGYPPEDLLLRSAFYEKARAALEALLADTADLALHLVVGVPVRHGRKRYNAALVLHRGRVVGEYRKLELPNYDVFDEQRYFLPDGAPLVFEAGGVRFGVVICEDFWFERAPRQARGAGAQVLLALNGSPFHMDKQSQRVDVARENVSALGLPMIAANLVGGQDELVFDGLSFALDARGELLRRALSANPTCWWSSLRWARNRCRARWLTCNRARWRRWSRSSNRSTGCWCWACATISARTGSRPQSLVCRGALTRRSLSPLQLTPWAQTGCAR